MKTFKRKQVRRTDAEIEELRTKYDLHGDRDTLDGWNAAFDAEGEAKAAEEIKTRQNARKAAKNAPPKEHEIQRAIGKALEDAGYMVVRVNSSTNFTEHGTRLSSYRVVNINATSGHADLVVYKRGRAWMLEVKRPGGKPSETQVRFAECCARYGVPYHVVTSPEDALAVLRLP
ncbi:hypothetical protein UFOVP422_5 [uncultured Caudovirales phage]|uniref:VRR-NUC domain containing protein n=1 Tax=uncultured Caudovirales phage TaxID=2100421 RepID=A0A6J5M4C0_9CAUD|nr:hypothetical protein UFOVP422_5 [uncultured Caudovirales phage]